MFPVRSVTYVPGLYPRMRSPPPLTAGVIRSGVEVDRVHDQALGYLREGVEE